MRLQIRQALRAFAPILVSRARIFLRRSIIAFCLASALLLASPKNTFAFSLNGYRWTGSQIDMHLGLDRPPVAFQDGSASWNASAADALATWNQYVDSVKFIEAGPVSPSGGDGANSIFFSNTIYGQAFGSSTLAVTINYSNLGSGVFTETDVLFNNARTWNSYRGPIQGSGATATYDFHRVALHEFGHVLGLDHPDQHGQNVIALMNSIITDLDHLADDDIAGGRSLYAFKLTSSLNATGKSGENFAYQITANNNPATFSATGLPAGFQLDASTGLISGRCSTSGTFQVDVAAQGALGTATGRVQIVITPLPITSPTFIQVQVGENMSYQISAGNSPTSYGATGLPAGLQANSTTGLISGIPQNTGTFDVRITANSTVSEAAATLRIVVMPPRITSSTLPPGVELGDPFTYQITATNSPTSFGVANLPGGLQLNPATGLITGTSTSAGVFNVTVTAQTAFGTASALVQVNIRAPRITSSSFVAPVDLGGNFAYQITGSNHPYSFSATGLPAGLSINPTTGEISGVAELSGQFQVQVTATGATGTASATLTITIRFLDSPDLPLKKLPLTIYGTVLADPARPRLYAVTTGGLAIVDTDSLTVIQTIPTVSGTSRGDLCISADGNKLWVSSFYDTKIRSIDLNTLTLSTTLPTSLYPNLIREGADGRLYVTDVNQRDVFQLDASTGVTLSRTTPPGTSGSSTIETSPDRKTLYVVGQIFNTPIARYTLSPGNAPGLTQQIDGTNGQSQGRRLAVSPNGASVSVVTANSSFPTPKVDPTLIRLTTDLNVVQGSFVSPSAPTQIVYNQDGSLAFQAMQQRSRIDVFQTANAQLIRTITLPDGARASEDSYTGASMAVDRTGSYLFVAALTSQSPPGLYIFSLIPPARAPTPPKTLLNISTRLRSLGGDNVLIGGFIVTGQQPKNLVVRAIGPSLPLTGKLADPTLGLYDATGALVAQNDNWNAHRADVLATGLAPLDEHEAVLAATLQPGRYTAIVRGVNDSSGVALVEAYDLTANSNSKLANISTRGKVETGDNVMIGGFILGGDQITNVAVRAIGSSLTNFGVAGALLDPILEVHDGNGALFAQNDDWRMSQEQALIDSGLAPTDNRESAMLLWLQPGAYTAIVRGKDDSVGVGLVEVYNLAQ